MHRSFLPVATVVIVFFAAAPLGAAEIRSELAYRSTISVDDDGPLDLVAELNYDDARSGSPIAVVMHGYSPTHGNLANVRAQAMRLRDAGFFAISVAMRGRDGSDGRRDSGGLEIYDIYDAVESAKERFPALVDPTNVHITGYSGGGGNVMSALTRFPDYFRAGSSFFGMSDYGFDPANGWYHRGAGSSHRAILDRDVGDPNQGDAAVLNRYHARASNRAAQNNPYSEVHLFVNRDEATSPLVNHVSFREMAVAAASSPGEFDNITLHIGDPARKTFEDFNGNGVNDPHELQFWPHQFPTANQQESAELWYRDRLLDGSIPEPRLNPHDTLIVTGFVKTRSFELRLGDGQNAVGELAYQLSRTRKTFDLTILSSDRTATGTLWVDLADVNGRAVHVTRNGRRIATVPGKGIHPIEGLAHGDSIVLAIPEPTGFAGAALLGLGVVIPRRGPRAA